MRYGIILYKCIAQNTKSVVETKHTGCYDCEIKWKQGEYNEQMRGD